MKFLVFFFSIIFPIHAVGMAMLESIKKRTGMLPLFSVALAFATITLTLIPPETYDLYRHYARIDNLRGLSFIHAMSIAEPGYKMFHFYAWLTNSLGLPKQFFTASVVFASYFLVFSVFVDFKKRLLNKEKKLTLVIVFCVFWLSIGFIMIASGIRNGLANAIVFYIGYHFIYNNRTALFLLGAIFAFFVHPFAALPALLIFVSKKLLRFSKYAKIFVPVGALFIVLPGLSPFFIYFLNHALEGFSFYKENYFQVDSKWGGGFSETRSINGLIVSFGIKRLSFYVAVLYMLLSAPKKGDPLYFLLSTFILVIGVFFYFYSFSGRVISIFIFFFSVYICTRYVFRKNDLNALFICLFLGALTFHSVFHMYEFREFLLSSYDWLYKPLPLLLFGY